MPYEDSTPLAQSRFAETADMPPEEFRRAGREVVEWITDYLANAGDLPVLSRWRRGISGTPFPLRLLIRRSR
jgi:hypothetical protein